MSRATAIGSAESKRRRLSAQFRRHRRPQTLAACRIVAEPNGDKPSVRPQIINMPVRSLGYPTMMSQPSAHPARSKSAARVDSPARHQNYSALSAYGDSRCCINPQQQRIGAVSGFRLRFVNQPCATVANTICRGRPQCDRRPAASLWTIECVDQRSTWLCWLPSARECR